MGRLHATAALLLVACSLVVRATASDSQEHTQTLAEAKQLASTLTLSGIPQDIINTFTQPATAVANAIDPFLPINAQPNPSTTTEGITLTLNVTEVKNGDWVGVTVSNVSNPTTYDALAIYLEEPSQAAVGLVRLIKYQWSNQDPAYITSGKTSFSFRVINQRRPLVFKYFVNATVDNGFFSLATLAASSGVVPFGNYNDPQQVHLALTRKQGEVLVQWTTRDAGTPTVLYGLVTGVLLKVAVGTHTTYLQSDMCGAPANETGFLDPGALNYVTVSGLLPDTTYYYKVGDLSLGMSEEFSFSTAPALGPSGTAHIFIIADHGHAEVDGSTEYEYTQGITTDAVTIPNELDTAPSGIPAYLSALVYNVLTDDNAQQGSAPYTTRALVASAGGRSLFLLNGDVSYARGEVSSWDVYMEQMQSIGSIVPWMLTEGNHERDVPFTGDGFMNQNDDSGGECSVPYARRTQSMGMPKWSPASPAWYSFSQGPVHYLAYSTEIDFTPGSAQYQFIEADLAAVDRSVTPWVVLNGHRPIYTTSAAPTVVSVAQDLRNSLEPLLLKYQVDITFHGHDHIYERTCPLYNGTCQANLTDGSLGGPVHVVLGNAGFTLSYLPNPFLPPYWETVVLEHGYAPCTITATEFSCQMISSITGALLDSFTLTKPAGFKPDLAGRTAFLASFNQTYFPGGPYPGSGTYIEVTGIPAIGLFAVFTVLQTSLTDPAVIAELIAVQEDLFLSANGPDTVVQLAASTGPFLTILEGVANSPCSDPLTCAAKYYAATAYVPILQQLQSAGAAWPSMHGILYPH